jgi:methyl-accepting chemotaxis protein-1 (serine sensor receptor)
MFNNITIKLRLASVLCILSFFMIVLGDAGLFSLSNTNDALRRVYQERLVSMGELDTVIRAMLRNQLLVAKAVSEDPAKLPSLAAAVEQNRAEANAAWERYAESFVHDEEWRMAERFKAARSWRGVGGGDRLVAGGWCAALPFP